MTKNPSFRLSYRHCDNGKGLIQIKKLYDAQAIVEEITEMAVYDGIDYFEVTEQSKSLSKKRINKYTWTWAVA